MTTTQKLQVATDALEKISTWKFGWDGDCGVTAVADEALAILAAPSTEQPTATVDGLPELPVPLEIFWPELHCQALGCGLEDWGIHDRYEAAQYGWQDCLDRAVKSVPGDVYDADQMRAYGLACIAQAAPAGDAVAWLVTGPFTKTSFAYESSAAAYTDGLRRGHPEGDYLISPLFASATERVAIQPAGAAGAPISEDTCDDEGCPHFGKALCAPKPGGCIATYAATSGSTEQPAAASGDGVALNEKLEGYVMARIMRLAAMTNRHDELINYISTWGAQQREAGRRETADLINGNTAIMVRRAKADAAKRAEAADKERDDLRDQFAQQKARGDNHAETLRGISSMDVNTEAARMKQWAKDGLTGYTQANEVTLKDLMDENADLRAQLAIKEADCSKWMALVDAAHQLEASRAKRTQLAEQKPFASAISYWDGPREPNGDPREGGFANIGLWGDWEPTTLKHGMAVAERGDKDKRVKFLYDVPQLARPADLSGLTRYAHMRKSDSMVRAPNGEWVKFDDVQAAMSSGPGPAHETIVADGGTLTCTACGTTAPVSEQRPAAWRIEMEDSQEFVDDLDDAGDWLTNHGAVAVPLYEHAQPAAKSVAPAHITLAQVGIGQSSQGYVRGWNDCVDAIAGPVIVMVTP